MDQFVNETEQNVLILMNSKQTLVQRYASAMNIARNARKIHESMNEKMKSRELKEPTPERLFELYTLIKNKQSVDIKGDLVEIEAIAAIASEYMMDVIKKLMI